MQSHPPDPAGPGITLEGKGPEGAFEDAPEGEPKEADALTAKRPKSCQQQSTATVKGVIVLIVLYSPATGKVPSQR